MIRHHSFKFISHEFAKISNTQMYSIALVSLEQNALQNYGVQHNIETYGFIKDDSSCY
jgi:hypothetical protein